MAVTGLIDGSPVVHPMLTRTCEVFITVLIDVKLVLGSASLRHANKVASALLSGVDVLVAPGLAENDAVIRTTLAQMGAERVTLLAQLRLVLIANLQRLNSSGAIVCTRGCDRFDRYLFDDRESFQPRRWFGGL